MKEVIGKVIHQWNQRWIILLILLIGLGLRLWGIEYGLPFTYRPDEPTLVEVSLRMLRTGDLNPHTFGYPSIVYYLNATVYLLYFLTGRFLGYWKDITSLIPPEIVTMGVGRELTSNLLLLGRGLAALFGTGCVWLTYLIGKRLHKGYSVALIASGLVAVSPTVIASSQTIAPDIYALFFVLVSFWGAIQILDDPNWHNYVISGVGAGLAISCKYNVVLIVLAMFAAHIIRWGKASPRRKELYIGLASSGMTFLLSSPYLILNLPVFVQTFGFNASVYISAGHAGEEGNAVQWYPMYLMSVEGLFVLFALLQSLYIAVTRSKPGIVLLAFPIVYYLAIIQLLVRNERTVMPVVPFLALLAALFLITMYQNVKRISIPQGVTLAFILAISVVMFYTPVKVTFAADQRLSQIDGRETARVWLDSNLPIGSRVAQEAYTPYIDTRRFVVQGIDAIVDKPPDWYLQNGFEYLIFSQGMYGRFFADSAHYSVWVDKYNEFFSRFTEIKHFDDNGYEVRIYKTGAVLPPHRAAARFGNYGEVIELVGYDIASSKWVPGESLTVKLFWRTLADKSEPLAVALHLVDKNNHEVGSTPGDLFEGRGWQEGIFETDWTIPKSDTATPGMYDLNVNVIQTQYSYSLPAKTWAGDDMGQVALGPFKMSVLSPSENELQSARLSEVHFGDEIALLRYSVTGNARASGSLPVTLYWQALAKPTHDYTVFVHLLDADGKVVAQVDAPPRAGTYPTTIWDVGEIIRDDYSLKLPADLAPGSYRIELGLYEYPSLARLPVTDANGNALGDHWVLPDSIQVVQ